MTLLIVTVGGFFGTIARYLVDFRAVSRGVTRVPMMRALAQEPSAALRAE